MGLAPGNSGFGTGPAGKTKRNTMGQGHAPNVLFRQIRKPDNGLMRGSVVSRGYLGKRGR